MKKIEKEKKRSSSLRHLFVKVMCGETLIALHVDPNDSIANLKSMIKDKKGFPVDKQRIVYNRIKLEDDRTVRDYNIQNESTLNLVLPVPDRPNSMELTIRTETRGLVRTLKVSPTDSILDVKEKIREMTGVPIKKQILIFAGQKLENIYNISDYNIQNKSFIDLVEKITVYFATPFRSQQRIELVLGPIDTIGSVKEKIHDKTRIPLHQQVLKFNDKELRDVDTLNQYNIGDNSIIFVYVTVEIVVKYIRAKVTQTLKLFKSDTIKDVKERIQVSKDIPCDMQRLYFRGQRLIDSHSLNDLGIQNESILHCTVMITIHIMMPNDNEISVEVNLDEDVRSVTKRIQANGAIPPDQLCFLMYNGEKLNNSYTLRNYGLSNGSILRLVKSGVGTVDLRIDGMAQRSREASSNQPSTQDVFNRIAYKCFEKVDVSNPDELNGFLTYLEKVRKVLVLDVKTGSLIFTLECGSVQILDDLWKDDNTGHLSKVAQRYLVTDDILQEFNLSSFNLVLRINSQEYRACLRRLTTEEYRLWETY